MVTPFAGWSEGALLKRASDLVERAYTILSAGGLNPNVYNVASAARLLKKAVESRYARLSMRDVADIDGHFAVYNANGEPVAYFLDINMAREFVRRTNAALDEGSAG